MMEQAIVIVVCSFVGVAGALIGLVVERYWSGQKGGQLEQIQQECHRVLEALRREASEAWNKLREERLKVEEAWLKVEKAQLKAEEARLKAEDARLQAVEAWLKVEEARLKAEDARLKADQAEKEPGPVQKEPVGAGADTPVVKPEHTSPEAGVKSEHGQAPTVDAAGAAGEEEPVIAATQDEPQRQPEAGPTEGSPPAEIVVHDDTSSSRSLEVTLEVEDPELLLKNATVPADMAQFWNRVIGQTKTHFGDTPELQAQRMEAVVGQIQQSFRGFARYCDIVQSATMIWYPEVAGSPPRSMLLPCWLFVEPGTHSRHLGQYFQTSSKKTIGSVDRLLRPALLGATYPSLAAFFRGESSVSKEQIYQWRYKPGLIELK